MPAPRAMRVLLVDDGRSWVGTLVAPVTAMGYEVLVANGGNTVTSEPTSSPDVIVLTLGSSGPDTLTLGRVLRARVGEKPPLVVGLADSEACAEQCTVNVGVHLVLTHPIDPAVFVGVLRRFRELLVGLDVCASDPPSIPTGGVVGGV